MRDKKPPLEKNIQRRILNWLKTVPGGREMNLHTSRFGMRGTPDILFVLFGQAFFFEVKRRGEKARPNQLAEIEKWRAAGAIAAVVRSVDDVRQIVNDHAKGDRVWKRMGHF